MSSLSPPRQRRALAAAAASSPRAVSRGAGDGHAASVRPMDHVIGHRIRDLRRAKGVTIPQLATRIGRSTGWLSQIERGLSALSISALHEIAGALEVQVTWFFDEVRPVPSEENGLVVRRANRRRLEFPGSSIVEELLVPNLSGALQMVLTTIEPGGSTGDRARERRGEEAGLVLRGTIELALGGARGSSGPARTFRLAAGDSFAFTQRGTHRASNPGRLRAVVVWVMTPPSY